MFIIFFILLNLLFYSFLRHFSSLQRWNEKIFRVLFSKKNFPSFNTTFLLCFNFFSLNVFVLAFFVLFSRAFVFCLASIFHVFLFFTRLCVCVCPFINLLIFVFMYFKFYLMWVRIFQ